MKINIQSLHFTPRAELNDFVTEKVTKLLQYFEKIEGAEIVLKLDKSDETLNKVCEIRLLVIGKDLFSKHQCKTFEEAVANSVEALEKQIQKMRSKF